MGFDTQVPLPKFGRVRFYHDINDRYALLGTLGWEDRSALDTQVIPTSSGSLSLERNWRDTWKSALGFHYRPVDKWLLQAGFAYDTAPVDSEDRTPDMPLDRQLRYAVGAQYKWSERLSVGGALEYADYGDAKIDRRFLRADYDKNGIFFAGFNVNWKFRALFSSHSRHWISSLSATALRSLSRVAIGSSLLSKTPGHSDRAIQYEIIHHDRPSSLMSLTLNPSNRLRL